MFTRAGTLRRLLRRAVFFVFAAVLCFTAFAPLPRTEPAVRNADTGAYFLPDYGKTLVAAHRTGKGLAPENTRMAVESCLASETPPDIIETDLQCTADGELVLYHSLYLDENSNAAEYFGHKNVTVFSKTYAKLRELNMGEKFVSNGKTPYAGLRGEDIPENLRIPKIEDILDLVEGTMPGKFRYIIEIKYPFPWAPKMVDKLYTILSERQLTDRVIVGSYWQGVADYIDAHYKGKLMRSSSPLEIIDFYGCYKRNEDLSGEDIPFMALQMPYYWKDDRLLLANFGQTGFIDYAHSYGISVQYFTISRTEDAQDLVRGGADVLMTNHPERTAKAIRETELFD